ncbi:MAG: hypothetical protein LUD72_10805 [Bacteroidales bacterium]|nr:hypothetical protein [Bacteroidales bacterium]
MSITRKLLKGMGLSEEQQDTIIEEHTSTVNDLKAERDEYKAEAEKAAGLRADLEKAQRDLEDSRKDSYKVKYEAIKEDFDEYKQQQQDKETHTAKEKAYRDLLKDIGISDKRIASVMRVSDVDSVELEDGKIKDSETLGESLKDEWSDFIQTTETKGADVSNPPGPDNSKSADVMTKEDIMAIPDRQKRVEEIAKHKDLFKKEN